MQVKKVKIMQYNANMYFKTSTWKRNFLCPGGKIGKIEININLALT